jgi:ferredoxin-NADP reductase
MPIYRVQLQKSEEVAEGTMSFYFDRPAGFDFEAGEYLELTLLGPPETDDKGNTRNFSIASAPFQEHLMITTRIRESALKRVLKNSQLGMEVQIEGPDGFFTLRDGASASLVFIAGGIGITPFLSMLRQAAHDHLSQRLYLFYSNRRPEDAAFLAELRQLESELPSYRFIPTMTDVKESDPSWRGETGRIDATMLTRHVEDLASAVFYTAGPPAMVVAMRNLLTDMGIRKANIRAEQFAGY